MIKSLIRSAVLLRGQIGFSFGNGDIFCTCHRLYQQRPIGFQRDIMRRSTVYTLVSAFYYQQMPVLHTRMETHALITQMFLQIFHQHIGFFGRNMSRRMVLDSTPSMQIILQRIAISPGFRSTPILAASNGPRPSYTFGRS